MSEDPQSYKESLQEELESLTHADLCEITESSLKRLITSDSLLKDLPVDVTLDEVHAQIAIIRGESISVTILRSYEAPIAVVIPQQGTTVLDLKKAFQRAFNLKQKRLKSCTKISWKYVWKTYDFVHEGSVMRDDNEFVSNYGVRNRSEIAFIKKLRKLRH